MLLYELALELGKPGCAIIKHNNPCGAACASTVHDAFKGALKGDPLSAFGGLVAFNVPVDVDSGAVGGVLRGGDANGAARACDGRGVSGVSQERAALPPARGARPETRGRATSTSRVGLANSARRDDAWHRTLGSPRGDTRGRGRAGETHDTCGHPGHD